MTVDDCLTSEEASKHHWEDLLRKMLPAGAPLPDEDQLDYSISVEYQPPTHPIHHPTPIIKHSTFTKPRKFPQHNHKYSPNLGSTFVNHVSDTGEDELSDVLSLDSAQEEQEDDESTTASPVESTGPTTKKTKKKKKKNVCSRCGKGNRMKEKELCIVCDSRYCSNCLLKAMGSMPEGRKCVSCIGEPIDESRRQMLGKCSRILSKVCSALEVRQIMIAEKECSANQLRPEQVVVNGRQLQQEDLVEVFGCPVPPRKLRPGRYWYDKDSGLWGQEGEKPDRIISSKLNVGGKLQVDASKGNTQVYINGREITKVELRVLKLAKVQCPQGTHFWLYDDGSYEEEGQNNIKGNIWGKASTRFICSLFSLPVPHEHSHGSTHDQSTFSSGSMPQNSDQMRVKQLLLFGLEGSGTSTIFKQVRFLYGDKFTAEESQNLKLMIQSNMYRYLSVLLEGRERFEEEALTKSTQSIYSFDTKFKHFSDWLLDIVATGDFDNYFPAATREYAPLVQKIWKDRAIQETYKRRNELRFLPDVAKYFLDQAIELSSNDYEPSEKDILYAEGVTPSNGLSYLDFTFDDRSPMSEIKNENFDGQSPLVKYQLIRLTSTEKQYENCKWLNMFEDARIIIFCVSLSDYDQLSTHNNKNKMLANRDSFKNLANQPYFLHIPFILILNKYDNFEEKIARVPLTICDWFSDFSPLKLHHNNKSLANQAYYYVAMKFKELYGSITGRKLFVCQSMARERTSVDEALKYIREVIRWDEDKEGDVYGINISGDDSFYTAPLSL